MGLKTYNLFISHSWSYNAEYSRLKGLLEQTARFKFKNYSVPIDDPIHTNGTDIELRQAIQRQMAPTSVVVIIAGVYATHSRWINTEIDLAESGFRSPKPIVAVRPWGSQRISARVKASADQVVGWNSKSIVRAIRAVAR